MSDKKLQVLEINGQEYDLEPSNATDSVVSGSTDVLTSGGAYTALSGKADKANTAKTDAVNSFEEDQYFDDYIYGGLETDSAEVRARLKLGKGRSGSSVELVANGDLGPASLTLESQYSDGKTSATLTADEIKLDGKITTGTNHRLALKEISSISVETTDHDEDFVMSFESDSRNVSIDMGGDGVLKYDEGNGVLEVYRDVKTTEGINISTNKDEALIIGDKDENYWEFSNYNGYLKDSAGRALLEVDSDGWIFTPYVATDQLTNRNESQIEVQAKLYMTDDIDMNEYSVRNVEEITFADGTSMSTAAVDVSGKVNKSGDTMTGSLVFTGGTDQAGTSISKINGKLALGTDSGKIWLYQSGMRAGTIDYTAWVGGKDPTYYFPSYGGTFAMVSDIPNLEKVETAIKPRYHDTIDLGSSTKQWRNAYIAEAIYSDTGNVTAEGKVIHYKMIQNSTSADSRIIFNTPSYSNRLTIADSAMSFGTDDDDAFNVKLNFTSVIKAQNDSINFDVPDCSTYLHLGDGINAYGDHFQFNSKNGPGGIEISSYDSNIRASQLDIMIGNSYSDPHNQNRIKMGGAEVVKTGAAGAENIIFAYKPAGQGVDALVPFAIALDGKAYYNGAELANKNDTNGKLDKSKITLSADGKTLYIDLD